MKRHSPWDLTEFKILDFFVFSAPVERSGCGVETAGWEYTLPHLSAATGFPVLIVILGTSLSPTAF